jgi:hypothetical protein
VYVQVRAIDPRHTYVHVYVDVLSAYVRIRTAPVRYGAQSRMHACAVVVAWARLCDASRRASVSTRHY